MYNKLVIRVFMSTLPLMVLNFTGDRAQANSETCEQIRTVRRLAIKEDLNDENLAQLEYRYCSNIDNINTRNNRGNRGNRNKSSNILPPDNASEDCINLTVMMRLSRIAETNQEHLRLVESRQIVACELSNQSTNSSSENWPNGQYAKFGSSWYYPNGQYAKFGSSWYYPNGQYTKFGSSWYYPNGQSTSIDGLLSQACNNISRHECKEILSGIRNNKNQFWRDLSIIELSWKSYNITKSKSQ